MIHEIKSKEFGNSQIARGAFGSISIAILQTEKSKDEEFSFFSFLAIKTISNPLSPSSPSSSSSPSTADVPKLSLAVFSELAALRVLSSRRQQHENITPLLSVMTSGSTKSQHHVHVQDDISLVFPYCPIDLHEIIQSRRFGKGPLQLSFIRTIFRDILRGLQHVHATGIIHADMKPGNILLSSTGVIQLADFGLAQLYQSNDRSEGKDHISGRGESSSAVPTGLCSLHYRPPELLFGSTVYESSMDVWGAGLILCEMLSGRAPFHGVGVLDQLSQIMDVLGTPTGETWDGIGQLPDYGKVAFDPRSGVGLGMVLNPLRDDELLNTFVAHMVVMDPSRRWSAEQCLEHEWLAEEKGFCSRQDLCKELIPKAYTSCYEGYRDRDYTNEMKAHLLDQMRLDAVDIALSKRKSMLEPIKMNEHSFGIVPSSLPTLLASKLRAATIG